VVFLVLLLFAAAEVLAFVAVAHQIGLLLALLILVVVSAAGPAIVRRVGFGVITHAQERLARGEAPTREVLDGVMVLAGGVFICVPGFIGDAIGLLLMLGPVRRLIIAFAGHRISRRVGRFSGPGGRLRYGSGPVIDTGSTSSWPSPGGSGRELGS
jgi:UPF0716 protein FxsA